MTYMVMSGLTVKRLELTNTPIVKVMSGCIGKTELKNLPLETILPSLLLSLGETKSTSNAHGEELGML